MSTAKPVLLAASCRAYRPEDDEAIVGLLGLAFGAWPRVEIQVSPVEHLRWKLQGHPGSRAYHLVAEYDGRLVGTRPAGTRPAWVLGQTRTLRYSFDAAVHPDAQGRGIMRTLSDLVSNATDRQFDLHLGYSHHPAIARLRERNQGKPLGNKLSVLVHRPVSDACSTPPQDAPWSIRQVDAFDDRIDPFWAEAQRPFDLATARTSEFLNWRYCDRRAGTFTAKLAEQDGSILGYAVLRQQRGTAYIADLLAVPTRTDVVVGLIADALHHFRRSGNQSVECWCPRHHPYSDVLRGQGFVAKRRTIRPLYEPGRMVLSDLAFLADPKVAIHVMAGDTDLV